MVARELEAGTVRRVLCKHWMNSGGLHLVYPSARHMSAKVRVFRDFVIDWSAALPSSHAGERLSSPKLPPPDAV
jgi:DNA-binding transcriptional LysR family regulator